MRLVTTFIQNTESTDPDLSYLNRARFILSVADGHGADGVGILDAVIRNRHLFLSMTSGAEIDAGSVFTEDDLPVASDSRLGIAAFDPAYFSILAGKVTLRGDLDFGLNETQLARYLTANKYATQAWVAAQGFIGSDGLALYATREWVLGQNFAKASNLNNYLLKSVWDEVFEITTENGVRVLNVKMDIAGLKGISAYGLGSTSGSGTSGSLGELVNVGEWADEVPAADRVMVQLAGATHWSAKPLSDLVGLDTTALAQYLTENSYLKASDISSYLTWANLSGKPTVYPTNWANIADKPTVYPTTWTSVTGRPTKLSQFTDDVVAGNYLSKPTWDAVFEVATVDGTPALKVKYDILGLKGITAYADGTPSGGFSGALVDLVDVAVTNLASGDILKYNGTHFVNVPVPSIAGASSWDQITGKPEYFPTRWADVSGAPTSLPANGGNAESAIKDGNGDIIANTYLPLSGNKTITGDITLPVGVRLIEAAKNIIGRFVFGSSASARTVVGTADVDTLLVSANPLKRHTGGSEFTVWDSGNLTKLSQLTNDVVPSWALATSNYYLPCADTRNTNYAPYNSNIPKGLTTVHLKNSGIDGLTDGGNFHSSIYISPWLDTSGGHAHNIAFTDNGNMWMRHGTTSWNEWVKVYHSGNSNLSTVDWSANNLNAAANLDVAGQAYVSGWLRSRGDVGWYSQDYGGGIHMTDSTWVRIYGGKGLMIDAGHIAMGQIQITNSSEASIGFRSPSSSSGDWCLGKGVSTVGSGFGLYNAVTNRVAFQIASATDAATFASSITAAGTVTATKLVIGGITIDVYNGALRVNGNLVATGGVTAYQ